MRKMKRPSGNQLTILILSILILVACFGAFYEFFFKPFNASLHNIAWAEDAEQSNNLWRFVTNRVAFDGKSVNDPNQPPMYWDAFRNSARLDIYGVTNLDRQEQVLLAVKDWQTTNRNMAKLQVRFYERENWKQFTNEQAGYAGGNRLPEVLLRESFIVLSNAQFDIILNSVAPKN
jgi:hypothetical protein